MIFLKSHNIIFIKNRKCAGTSIEIALTANAGPSDIITPLTAKDEAQRLRSPFRPAQNWSWLKLLEPLYLDPIRAKWIGEQRPLSSSMRAKRHLIRTLRPMMERFTNHMSPAQISHQTGHATFEKAIKISSVRHPYDQVLSLANSLARTNRVTRSASIDAVLSRKKHPQSFKADHIIRFENLQADLRAVEKATGLTLLNHLPHTKQTLGTGQALSPTDLTNAQKDLCYRQQQDLFEKYGYER